LGDTTIRGHACRGNGVVNNELYAGVLVWNRQRFIKDPTTGKRVSRPNPEAKWIRTEVPELRIVDDKLWQRVKLRQAELAKQFEATTKGVRAARAERLNRLRRPAFLLSGLLTWMLRRQIWHRRQRPLRLSWSFPQGDVRQWPNYTP
jgi:hypothetical protein